VSADQEAAPALPRTLKFHRDREIGILELNRPQKRNALDDRTILGLHAFFSSPPPDIRAVVLAAVGENFSAGLDLAQIPALDQASAMAHSMRWHRAFEAIEFGTLPVVSVLKGAVIGGGLEIAAATHVRVAERSAYYALPEAQRGIFVGGGASVRLPRLIGTSRVMEMMLTGRVYDAAAGEGAGFSHYVVDDGAGMSTALELARKIAGNPPFSNFAVMHALPRIAEAPPASGYLAEAAIAALAVTSEDAQQRVGDFLAKRGAKVSRR
jgi:enoyl-CoA hydratase/carnithine racemase